MFRIAIMAPWLVGCGVEEPATTAAEMNLSSGVDVTAAHPEIVHVVAYSRAPEEPGEKIINDAIGTRLSDRTILVPAGVVRGFSHWEVFTPDKRSYWIDQGETAPTSDHWYFDNDGAPFLKREGVDVGVLYATKQRQPVRLSPVIAPEKYPMLATPAESQAGRSCGEESPLFILSQILRESPTSQVWAQPVERIDVPDLLAGEGPGVPNWQLFEKGWFLLTRAVDGPDYGAPLVEKRRAVVQGIFLRNQQIPDDATDAEIDLVSSFALTCAVGASTVLTQLAHCNPPLQTVAILSGTVACGVAMAKFRAMAQKHACTRSVFARVSEEKTYEWLTERLAGPPLATRQTPGPPPSP